MFTPRTFLAVSALLLLGLPACGDKSAETATGDKPVASAVKTIAFEEQLFDKKRIKAKVPVGWKKTMGLGETFAPGEASEREWGFMSRVAIGTTCGGMCEPKSAAEWAAMVDKDEVAGNLNVANAKKLKDEPLGPTGRLVVVSDGEERGSRQILVARWKDRGEMYAYYRVTLRDRGVDGLAAFEEAAKAMEALSLSATISE